MCVQERHGHVRSFIDEISVCYKTFDNKTVRSPNSLAHRSDVIIIFFWLRIARLVSRAEGNGQASEKINSPALASFNKIF